MFPVILYFNNLEGGSPTLHTIPKINQENTFGRETSNQSKIIVNTEFLL